MQALSFPAGAPAVQPQVSGQGKEQPSGGGGQAFALLLAASGQKPSSSLVQPGSSPVALIADEIVAAGAAVSNAVPSVEKGSEDGKTSAPDGEKGVVAEAAAPLVQAAISEAVALVAVPASTTLPAQLTGEAKVQTDNASVLKVDGTSTVRASVPAASLASPGAPVATSENVTASKVPPSVDQGAVSRTAEETAVLTPAEARIARSTPSGGLIVKDVQETVRPQALAPVTDAAPRIIETAGNAPVRSVEPATHAAGAAVHAQIVKGVVKAGVADGGRVTIHLTPQELGRVEVTLIKGDGHHSARIVVDRAETLDIVRSEIRHLERSLAEAGMDVRSGSISIALRGSGAEGSMLQHRNEGDAAAPVAPTAVHGSEDAMRPEAGTRRLADGRGSRLNISV